MSDEMKHQKINKPAAHRIQRISNPATTSETSLGTSPDDQEGVVQRINSGTMPLNGEQVNHLHQTIGTQATIQLLRERQANYKPMSVLKAYVDPNPPWVQRVAEVNAKRASNPSLQKGENTVQRQGAVIQREGGVIQRDSLAVSSLSLMYNQRDTNMQSFFQSFAPTLHVPEGTAGNIGSTFAKIQGETTTFNTLGPLQLWKKTSYLDSIRKKVLLFLGKYTGDSARTSTPERDEKYRQVYKLYEQLTNPRSPVRIFEMIVYQSQFQKRVQEDGVERSEGTNFTGKALIHLRDAYAIENFNFPKHMLWLMTQSNKTVQHIIDVYDRYIDENNPNIVFINISSETRAKISAGVEELKGQVASDAIGAGSPAPNELLQLLNAAVAEIMQPLREKMESMPVEDKLPYTGGLPPLLTST
ncbi:MAG: hypothetical protein AAF639_17665 [Chloroflexota bacterium]